MKNIKNKLLFLCSIILVWTACRPVHTISENTPSPLETASKIPETTEEVGRLLQLPTPVVGTVALDFSEDPCSASWSNNGEYLACPGDIENISSGYIDRFDEVAIEGDIHINQPGLLTIPAQPGTQYYAIFGKYPSFTVIPGDKFRSVLACVNNFPECDVSFSLEYFTPENTVLQVPGAKWEKQYDPKGSYIYAEAALDFIAGQTVQFLLAVRDNGNASGDHALWIMPHIARLGSTGTDAVPPNQLEITNVETIRVSGNLDMSSAPPFLYDDHPPGTPAVVVFFDLNSDLFFTVSTENTHPDFSLEVYPGEYYVLAYTQGVGDVPYTGAAFTGADPSCGKEMAVLTVLPETPMVNIIINDWNWSCGGSAGRYEKPEEVSLP